MLEDLLLPAPMQNMPDIVVIGTQESSTNREEWEICLQETVQYPKYQSIRNLLLLIIAMRGYIISWTNLLRHWKLFLSK